jgi:hypothetical protein
MKTYFQEPPGKPEGEPFEILGKSQILIPSFVSIGNEIFATSVPFERLFSTAGDIMTPERNRFETTCCIFTPFQQNCFLADELLKR